MICISIDIEASKHTSKHQRVLPTSRQVQHEEVAAPSFDASRLRLQIQVGLRMSSRVCSDKAREVVTPAAHEGGSAAAKILNIITFLAMQYIELREHQSISDDIVCPSPHRLRCGSPLPCR